MPSQNQKTVSENAAQVAEVLGEQKDQPIVIADPVDAATTQAAVIDILNLLRKMGVSTAS